MNINKYLTDHYKILKYLEENATTRNKERIISITLNDLEQDLKISRAKINYIKNELVNDGFVIHKKNTSKYTITGKGHEFLESVTKINKNH